MRGGGSRQAFDREASRGSEESHGIRPEEERRQEAGPQESLAPRRRLDRVSTRGGGGGLGGGARWCMPALISFSLSSVWAHDLRVLF